MPRLVADNRGLDAFNLGKSFRRRPVLRSVNIAVQRGEAVGLLGPNGAGKTTCFYIITGLIRPDVGTVTLDGEDITELPMYRRARLGIGYLPQEASIFRGLTVEQNLRAVLEVVGAGARGARGDDRVAARRVLDHAICGARRRWRFRGASAGGSRSPGRWPRKPHFILLDEPLASIDPIAVADIRDLVAHLKDRGIGVLLTDHNVREALEIVDRAYILHEGQVLMEGAPDANRQRRERPPRLSRRALQPLGRFPATWPSCALRLRSRREDRWVMASRTVPHPSSASEASGRRTHRSPSCADRRAGFPLIYQLLTRVGKVGTKFALTAVTDYKPRPWRLPKGSIFGRPRRW